jgi:hypothetical protein
MVGRLAYGRHLLLLAVGVLLVAARAPAVYLDKGQNVSVRARIYSQASIRISDSQDPTTPSVKAGQLVQHRTFYNPEFDAKLAPHLTWMRGGALDWLAPDELSLRVAGWGFYDGIYDYGADQFNDGQRLVNSTFGNFAARPRRAWFIEADRFNKNGTTLNQIFPNDDVKDPRDIYADQGRVNELYLSYSKGPVFFRIGRQTISWGESDTIALLDQNNPFDITLAAPGIFQDLDEARIPLWTIRSSFNLFDVLGPLSSGFVEAYWVPGDWDTNTGYAPILTASPYSAAGPDPQSQLTAAFPVLPLQFVLLDNLPKKAMSNSRWGVRLQTVVNRTFTVQGWYYTAFPNAPVPLKHAPLPVPGQTTQLMVTETVHDLTSVFGLANTFFFEPLDGIVRMELEYFDNEPAFIAKQNLGLPDVLRGQGSVPKADFLRWEIGFDRFFFFRPLNPGHSFTWVTAVVGSHNLDETSKQDFRFNGQLKQRFFKKRAGTAPVEDDFVQLKGAEVFAQTTLQTDYWHGRLTPRFTVVATSRGTYQIHPALDYRWRDWMLLSASLVHIGGEYQSFGFFRDRDQIALRVTYQLN